MPNPKRLLHKRKLAQCLGWLDDSTQNLAQIHLIFDDGQHEKYLELLDAIIMSHLMTKSMIEDFWRFAYGQLPVNPDTYR